MCDFCITGELFVRENAHAKSNNFAPDAFTVVSTESHATHKFSAAVPAHWITHALIRPDREDVLLPVPRWAG